MNQREMLSKADAYLAGGTLGAFHLPPDVAMVFTYGQGTKLVDANGKEYVDFLLGSGPMILAMVIRRLLRQSSVRSTAARPL